MIIKLSVRNLVEFILRAGDIDHRRRGDAKNAMLEGGRIHRMIQRRMGSNYRAEVKVQYTYPTENYDILLEGRADGIIEDEEFDQLIIDEIKGTYRNIHKMKGPLLIHLAQAKCYAYIYGKQRHCKLMGVRMTYCNLETEALRYFDYTFEMKELENWFFDLMEQYKKWSDVDYFWKKERLQSIKELNFPFAYRTGQKELATQVYRSIYHQKKLFIEAPTGVGKTLSTIFPAVKAIGEGHGEKIFYLTAKTITRTVAENTFELLRGEGLKFRTVTLTAKEKICFLEEMVCNPSACPYAKGHFDRINNAIYDFIVSEDDYSREKIEAYAKKHYVCPFELGLDISLFSDGIIGDYNYLFDPHVYLKRFFIDGVKGEYLFLIDEVHNLVERGREMYSAVLCKEDFIALRNVIKSYDKNMDQELLQIREDGMVSMPSEYTEEDSFGELFSEEKPWIKIARQLEQCNKNLLLLKRQCETYRIIEEEEKAINLFIISLNRLVAVIEKYFEKQDESPIREEILDFYFEINHFLMIYGKIDEKYYVYSELQSNGDFILKLLCVDPSKNLQECMERGKSSILFSATLLPIQYFKRLLGGTEEDYEVYAESVFQPEKKLLLVAQDVTSKYTRRSDLEFYNIAQYIYEITRRRHGNYLVFFPSHQFLKSVLSIYMEEFLEEETEITVQEEYMAEVERESFLHHFTGNPEIDLSAMINMAVEIEDKILIGFCVLGGIFSEGIDLKYDSLIGTIIVGTGIPQVCVERELIKEYFDKKQENGFDYAYKIPGMNKVLQSAGRVIRTQEDVGIVALLDERFLEKTYLRLFPKDWERFTIVEKTIVGKKVERFWDEWL